MARQAPAPAPPAADQGLTAAFAAAMARLGPWDASRRVAVAVSGGADSLALAVLAQGWGDPVGLIVDHGLREGSAAEAESAQAALVARGMPARIIRLHGLAPGPGVAARARVARYAALSAACRQAGLVDLLLGHHAGDQAETVLMRRRSHSGPAGLAGMAVLVETDDLRLLRPLLGVDPLQLRTLVAAEGLSPAEDPTNTDLRTTRARVRQEIGTARGELLAAAERAGCARSAGEIATAAELAARVSLYPDGYAVLSPGPVGEAALAALLRTLSGRRYPVSDVAELAASPGAATMAGVRLLPAGALGKGWLLVREAAAMQGPAEARPGRVWDGRFRVVRAPPGATIGAFGAEAAARMRRRPGLPAAVLTALPVFKYNGVLCGAVRPNYRSSFDGETDSLLVNAVLPVACAPFMAWS